ncbi:single-stranded DNA-binding protein [Calidifontibacter terrae]
MATTTNDSQSKTSPSNIAPCNEVHLIGEVRGIPELRRLPSGDEILALRVAVPRPDKDRRSTRSPHNDLFDLTCFTAAARRTGLSLTDGDVVEVEGAMRRSVRRGAGGVTSRMDLEVHSLRRCSPKRRAG